MATRLVQLSSQKEFRPKYLITTTATTVCGLAFTNLREQVNVALAFNALQVLNYWPFKLGIEANDMMPETTVI